ncbi:hypothetical protein KPH14_003560 [Odynerus spinipes]|uniref:Large ribosomal subunit protein uL3m n=1 Tax=Odynerus spinipes TaxID=1348599 RepID=A0AAD9VJW2_9HYME|nr:hypothetical protein KPH14_003560 [Odynerus spinipes]
MATLFKVFGNGLSLRTCLKQSLDIVKVPVRERHCNIPKKRHPGWLPKVQRVLCDEHLTTENKQFIREVVESKYSTPQTSSPLKLEPIEPLLEWKQGLRRTGLIAKKIGIYPMWLQNGKRVNSTLLQIVDNQVIKYIPPEQFHPVKCKNRSPKKRMASLVVGAESTDPQMFRKEYYNLFKDSGVMPKRVMMRFIISPEAALQPGTPLYATHFKPGDIIDIRGKTIDRGFQGVMKRWGFKGMPATHGVTKTHRRPGNIGSGGKLARVMPGTKLPGHMGNRWRVHRGYRILRINTKYNVIWVMGHNIPGETNSYCYLYDTLLPRRKSDTPPHFPTYLPELNKESMPEDMYADDVHPFKTPTIKFSEES